MLEILKEIREYIAVVFPLIIGILILISKLTKNSKLRRLSENLVQIENVVKEYVCSAEAFLNYSGSDKKEWVKTKVNQFCIQNGIRYDNDTVEAAIEKLIYLSKTVNSHIKESDRLL